MRTTVTLDPDVLVLLKKVMRERRISFKAALNDAVREGVAAKRAARPRRYVLKARHMGYRPEINLDKALSLAAAMEDEEILRKLSLGK